MLKLWIVAIAASLALPAYARDAMVDGIPPAEDAPIAMLVDVSSGQVLHERNAKTRFVPASITKVMTMFLAFELIEEGRLDPAQVMTVSPEVAKEWSGKGSTMFVEGGDRLRLADMLTAIANVSANDASIILATEHSGSVDAWTEAMTAKAHELEMTDSHFGTPNGWPDGGATFTTASDLVKLARALVTRHPAKFGAYMGKPGFTYNGITQSNYDPLIGRIEGADGIKTGFTNEAGFGFLGTAKRNGQRLVLVIAGARSNGSRARMAREYMEWGFAAFDRQRVFGIGEIVAEARVQNGSHSTLNLVTDRPVFVNIPAQSGEAARPQPEVRITYDGPLRAPISEGQKVAMMEISVPGMDIARVPLLAGSDVQKAGFFARIYNGILGWFS